MQILFLLISNRKYIMRGKIKMDTNKLIKGILWGVSTFIGLAVAEGIYRTSVNQINKRELLIGDGEIISDKIEDIEVPFDDRD